VRIFNFIKELYSLTKAKNSTFIILLLLTLLGILSTIPIPFLFSDIVEKATTTLTLNDLIFFVFAILTLQLLQAVFGIFRVKINRRFALDAANRLRYDFLGHIMKMPYSYFLNNNAGGQANSYLNDIDDIDLAITGFVSDGIRAFMTILFYFIVIIVWNPIIGVLAVVTFPIVVLAQRKIRDKVAESSRNKVDLRENIVSKVSEAVSSISVVKSFNIENVIIEDVDGVSEEFKDNDIVLETRQSLLRSTASVFLIFVQYSFFVIGAVLVIKEQLLLSAFLGQMYLLGRFIGPLHNLLEYVNTLNKSEAALHNVRRILSLKTEDELLENKCDLTFDNKQIKEFNFGINSNIRVNDLKFRYRDKLPLIEGWAFNIKAGETIAIVGDSGCGKSTFFNILLGLFDNYSGEILFDNTELSSIAKSDIRKNIGVVFQEHIFFNDTIRNNLLIAVEPNERESITDEELFEALKKAHAYDFVKELPELLDSNIGSNGNKLSGGQRQRLALARSIIKNPPILLLDEATSALDSFSEKEIQKALSQLFIGRTNIIIAHRLSTITKADKIVVIENNRVSQVGTHTELIQTEGLYLKLYNAQVQGFINSLEVTNG
jgi:subfamily B ATP-binding cassette protein MsbA